MTEFVFKTKPRQHQLEALERSHKLRYFALFMEAGTGKSKILLDEMRWAYDNGKINLAIVICPNGIQQNWILDQVPQHLAGDYAAAYYRSGMKASEKEEWRVAVKATDKLRLLAINFESLLNKEFYNWLKRLMKDNRAILIVDESHRIKTPKSAVTKALINLSTQSVARRIATGTPAPQGPMDLYAQLKFLDPSVAGHSTFTSFKAEHAMFTAVDFGHKDKQGRPILTQKIVGYRNLKELNARIDPFCYRKKLRDCTDLPPLISTDFYVTMTPQQERMYKELRDIAATSITECPAGLTPDQRILWAIENVDIVAQNPLTKVVRMQQVLAGFVKDDNGKITAVESNRISALLNLLSDLEGQIIIWTHGTSELEAIATELRANKYSVVTYYGATKPQERTAAIQDFQAGKARIFLGQPKAGGIGITLTAARHMVWFTVGYNYADYAQAQGRFERIGQEQPMVVHHMVSRGTLDVSIKRIINKKRETQEDLIWKS